MRTIPFRFLSAVAFIRIYWEKVGICPKRIVAFASMLEFIYLFFLQYRCEMLMKSAERELSEIERKKQAAESVTQQARPRSIIDMNREKLLDLEKQIEAESRKLAAVRSQLQKTKSAKSSDPGSSLGLAGSGSTKKSAGSSGEKANNGPGDKSSGSGHKVSGVQQRPVSEETLPELCG